MRVIAVRGHDIYSFADLDLELSSGLTVVTGPNGSGKTSVGRLLRLVRAGAAAAAAGNDEELNREYSRAGRFDVPVFGAELDIEFDRDWERAIIETWARAALLSSVIEMHPDAADAANSALPNDFGAADALGRGTLAVTYNRALRGPWKLTWRTPSGELDLISSRVGTVDSPLIAVTSWLQSRDDPLSLSIAAAPPAASAPESAAESEILDDPGPRPPMRSRLTMAELLGAGQFDLLVRPTRRNAEPALITDSYAGIGAAVDGNPRSLSFARVLDHLLEALIVSDGARNSAARNGELVEVPLEDLADPRADARADAAIGARLLRRKTGDPDLRASFDAARDMFMGLTGSDLDVAAEAVEQAPAVAGGSARWILTATPIVPVIAPGGAIADIPLRLSGQGLVEAARLALVLTGPGQSLLLDEPATELSAVAQRRLLERLRIRADNRQTIVITHSAHLVPISTDGDLALVRLTRGRTGATVAHRVRPDVADIGKNNRLLALADIRDALFAAAVWLVEGATEQEALRTWLADESALAGLPTPESAHVLIVSVDGAENFARYAHLMEELGIAYGILADGPALRVSAKGQLRKLPGAPDFTAVPDTFADRRAAWRNVGVWTVASDYHDGPGDKGGEIEAYFDSINAHLWARIRGDSKISRGAAFASRTPPPAQIVDLWGQLLRHTGLIG